MSPVFRRRIEFFTAAQKRCWVRIVYVLIAVIGIWDTAGSQLVPKSVGEKWPTIYELVMSMSGMSPWWGWVIGALGFALMVTVEYAVRRTVPSKPVYAAEPLSSRERSQWEQEWHDKRDVRREFWRLVNMAYRNWAGRSTDRSLQDLVEASQFPPELPLDDGRQFSKWAWTIWDKQNKGSLQTLRDFTSQIYPGVTPAESIKTQLMGDGAEFDRFDDRRRELSKFWDHWGRQEPLEEVIREQNADGMVRSDTLEIKLLTFLEIALARWAQTGATGKAGLFTLGKRNAETE